ncbi:MAG: outer membrane protein assembly factor BamE [Gammaproteobacteria bacterium]|nr:outer membrane protein assembly factor BamE [Gammaproteobacteria bacterium]
MKTIIVTCCIVLSTFLATACTSVLPEAHKIDIQQGNALKSDDLNKLSVGMSKKQVTILLGTPMIRDIFHKDRWDYVYTFKAAGSKDTKVMRLSLYFELDKLVKIDNVSYIPEM